jgi:hypothetical protein
VCAHTARLGAWEAGWEHGRPAGEAYDAARSLGRLWLARSAMGVSGSLPQLGVERRSRTRARAALLAAAIGPAVAVVVGRLHPPVAVGRDQGWYGDALGLVAPPLPLACALPLTVILIPLLLELRSGWGRRHTMIAGTGLTVFGLLCWGDTSPVDLDGLHRGHAVGLAAFAPLAAEERGYRGSRGGGQAAGEGSGGACRP